MIVTEYEGDDRVLLSCDKCGYRKWLLNPSTMQTLKYQCACVSAASSRNERPA